MLIVIDFLFNLRRDCTSSPHLVTSAQYKIASKYTKVNLLPATGKCSRQKDGRILLKCVK